MWITCGKINPILLDFVVENPYLYRVVGREQRDIPQALTL